MKVLGADDGVAVKLSFNTKSERGRRTWVPSLKEAFDQRGERVHLNFFSGASAVIGFQCQSFLLLMQ